MSYAYLFKYIIIGDTGKLITYYLHICVPFVSDVSPIAQMSVRNYVLRRKKRDIFI